MSNGDICELRTPSGRQVSGETRTRLCTAGRTSIRRSVQPGDSTLSRSSSGMWDWSGPPSVAGTPAPSRDSSQHNGVSMWNWGVGRQPSPDVSRENSRHGGMSMWNWGSRPPSGHLGPRLGDALAQQLGARRRHPSATRTGRAPRRRRRAATTRCTADFSKLAVETGKDRENSVRKGDIWNCEWLNPPEPSLFCVLSHTHTQRLTESS